MWTLGINWRWHDSAAALVDTDGHVVAFAEEERFTRVKHAWGSFPIRSTAYCLATAGITWRDVTAVAVGWAIDGLEADTDLVLSAIFGDDYTPTARPEVLFVEHHLAHALSTYHASGYDRAGVVVVDGSGEVDSATVYRATGTGDLEKLRSWDRRYSLGALYSAASQALGFGPLDAGKTMGLAPFGRRDETSVLPMGDLVSGEVDPGSPVATLSPDKHFDEFAAAWRAYYDLRVGRVERDNRNLHHDRVARTIAASAQRTVEEAVRGLYAEAVSLAGTDSICLAGGVALNCVANGFLPPNAYAPPFPHDAGVALGAAWYATPPKRRLDVPITPYLGLGIDPGDQLARAADLGFTVREFDPRRVVDLLLHGQVGAIAEGRAEIGPRALGHRSIVALPRPSHVQDRVNDLKRRERWRPFAPMALRGHADVYWPTQGVRENYMIGTAVVSAAGRRVMPAVTHVDGTSRPQTVPEDQPGAAAELLRELHRGGLPPVLVNTSFNGPGEPIVNSAAEALDGFADLGLDFLVLGDALITRTVSPANA
jgi:carbamoyltransferase